MLIVKRFGNPNNLKVYGDRKEEYK